MDNSNTMTTIPITAVFLLVIFAFPVVQGIVEIRESKSIQALDIVADALSTPYNNAKKLRALALKQDAYADSIRQELAAANDSVWERDRAENLIDEALVALGEIKKTALAKNRHVQADSSEPALCRIDTLYSLLSDFLQSVRDEAPASELAAGFMPIRERSASVTRLFPSRSIIDIPLLAIRNLKYILWNDKYLRRYEKEMENTSVFANTLRPQMQFLYYVLFRELGEKGVLGKDGWFFYKPDVDFLVKPHVLDPRSILVDPNDKPASDNPTAAILNFKKQLDSLGIDLLVVIIPGKPSIYPDFVSSRMKRESAGAFSHSLRFMDDLRKEGVDAIDLFAPFAKERMRDREAGEFLYLKEDTHWRARGLILAAKVIGDRIKQYPWFKTGDLEYGFDTVTIDRIGDVGAMTTLAPSRVSRFYHSFIPEKTNCYKVYRVVRDSLGAVIKKIPYKDDFRNADIIVLGDSFSRIFQVDEPANAGWISHLAWELSAPLCSIISDGGASTLVRERLARNKRVLRGKKLVVWEFIERDLRYGAEGWKDIKL